MMLRKILPLIVLAGVLTFPVVAQWKPPIPQVKPLGPEAAAIFKTLDRPIGTYTGTVPVQFPLFGVSSGSLKADVSLSYNSTGGIKVDETASCVGLGFALNDTGGRITQMVNGMQDDIAGGLIKGTAFNCEDNNHIKKAVQDDPKTIDPEPDLFLYSFNGQSGKFFFKKGAPNGTVVMMQKTGITIEPEWDSPASLGIKRWIVTDEQGNKYYFGWNKGKTIEKRSQNTYPYTSSLGTGSLGISAKTWYLLEVYGMNEADTITYQYQNSNSSLTRQVSGSRQLFGATSGCEGFSIAYNVVEVTTVASEAVVSRITARDGYILINGTSDRQDEGGSKINSIELYTPANVLKRRFTFNYNYFNPTLSAQEKRLKLLSFSQTGSSGSDAMTWSFEYNDASNGSYNLPARTSLSRDHWGFYNGKYNSSSFPNIVYRDDIYNKLVREDSYADKNVSEAHAQANTLKKITFPTLGTREFVYEGNKAHVIFDPDEYHPNSLYQNDRTASNISFTPFDNNVSSPSISQKGYFTVNSTDGDVLFTFSSSSNLPGTCTNIQASLYKTTTANQSTGGTFIPSPYPLPYYQLENGYYRLDIVKGGGCASLNHSASWKELTLSMGTFSSPHTFVSLNQNIMSVGGVRVSEIRDYDPVTNKTSTTSYEYKLHSTDPTKSSGLLISQPKYVAPADETGCPLIRLLINSTYPLAVESGSYVVYPEVRTRESGNGWTDQVFSFRPDNPPASGAYPIPPPYDYSRERGRLLEKKFYSQSGGLLKKVTNSYTDIFALGGPLPLQEGYLVRGIWLDGASYVDSPPTLNQLPADGYCTAVNKEGYGFDISKTTETTYTPQGSHVTETEYGYTYTADKKMMLTQVKTKVNNGATRVTQYRYPFTATGDFSFGLSGGEQTMKTTLNGKNYLQPIEVVDYLRPASGPDKLLGGTKIIFGTFNSSKLHIATLRSYTNSSTYTDVNYTQYDTYGNLQEQYKTNGAKEVYLWGYNRTYPVAKVVGSTYSTVAGLINQSVLDNPYSALAISSELDKIGRGLAGQPAQVTTYTYDRLVGMTSMTDPSGRITRYNFDPFGRLILVRDHEDKVVKKLCYNYQGQSYPCTVATMLGNQVQNISFRRVNCGDGYAGSNVSYAVAANTHYAPTQVEANLQALSEAYANGPAYANMTGTCTAATVSISYYAFSFFNPLAITFTFTSQTSGAQHVRTTIAGTGSGVLQGGAVPAGLYTVQINNPNSGNHFYDLACSAFVSGSGAQTVYNVVVHPDCPEVYIDY